MVPKREKIGKKPVSLGEGFLASSPERRRLAFLQAATEKQAEAAILEKDFWVCWLLGTIFSHPELEPHFVFKGGTSLSKVHHVIDRFSEDVDLGIAPGFLGIRENDFDALTSRTRRDEEMANMQIRCGEVLGPEPSGKKRPSFMPNITAPPVTTCPCDMPGITPILPVCSLIEIRKPSWPTKTCAGAWPSGNPGSSRANGQNMNLRGMGPSVWRPRRKGQRL